MECVTLAAETYDKGQLPAWPVGVCQITPLDLLCVVDPVVCGGSLNHV